MECSIFNQNRILFLDGGMGTMLQRAGLKAGEIPEAYNMLHPEIIADIHSQYARAGADIITTNTFGANEFKLKNTAYSVEEIITKAVELARTQANGKLVALDVGPTGHLLEPMGELSFEEAYEAFASQIRAGVKAGADIILIETMSDIYEARAAVLAAKENSSLPVFCTMSFQENGRTLTGTDPFTMVNIIQGLGVDALGVNCSVGPKDMLPIVKEILSCSSVPVIVQPNAGMPKLSGDQITYDVTPEEFAMYMKEIVHMGAAILGGCCGTTPEYIESVAKLLKGAASAGREIKPVTAVSSSRRTVILGEEIKVIGERINPTGKEKLRKALMEKDIDYIVEEAMEQKEAGAHILDVNLGLVDIDEKKLMLEAVQELQAMVDLPLQIDSMSPEVIEAAVRAYNGKPVINSVNGKEESMRSIFPIAKKYGACVIGLTLDEGGIPAAAEGRLDIARKIINTAEQYGIPKENIIIDCLVLTASIQQKEAMETIKAVRLVKEQLGVVTTLGISNVSFGLPGRELLNRTFLAMALGAGLDAPILNPMDEEIMAMIGAFRLLANQDEAAAQFIRKYGN
jgi:5-methyltetrahydrofolate--homocysteine methyltransferase